MPVLISGSFQGYGVSAVHPSFGIKCHLDKVVRRRRLGLGVPARPVRRCRNSGHALSRHTVSDKDDYGPKPVRRRAGTFWRLGAIVSRYKLDIYPGCLQDAIPMGDDYPVARPGRVAGARYRNRIRARPGRRSINGGIAFRVGRKGFTGEYQPGVCRVDQQRSDYELCGCTVSVRRTPLETV